MTAPVFYLLLGTLSGILFLECRTGFPAWLLYFLAAGYFLASFRVFANNLRRLFPYVVFLGAALCGMIHYSAADRFKPNGEEERFLVCRVLEKSAWARESEERKWFASLIAESPGERFKLLLFSQKPFPLRKGDLLAGTFRLAPLKGPAAPGCFDSAAHYARENVYRSAVLKGNFLLKGEGSGRFLSAMEKIRARTAESLENDRYPVSSLLLRIMLLGSREKLPASVERGIKKSGAAHILAVSGLHIGLLSGVWFLLTRLAGLSRMRYKLPLLPLLWIYALFLGDRPSVIRSVILMTLFLAGRVLGKATLSLHFLSLAAWLYALFSPKQIFSYSSLLSYASTAALLLMLPRFDALLDVRFSEHYSFFRRARAYLLDYFLQSLKISFAVLFFTLPLLLDMLHLVSPLGFLMNLAMIPLCGLLLVAGLFRLVIYFSPLPLVLSEYVWTPVLALWESIVPFIEWCGENNRLIINAAPLKPCALLVYYLTLLFFLLSGDCLAKYQKETAGGGKDLRAARILRSRLMTCRTIFLALLFFGLSAALRIRPPSSALRVTALNVGQGDSFVVSSDLGGVWAVDCGRSYGGSSQGEMILMPYLRSKGVNVLEGLVLSHYDDDHIGGAKDLIREMRLKRILAPPALAHETVAWELRELARAKNIPWLEMTAGEELANGGYRLKALSPPASPLPATSNGRSLVVLVERSGFRLLFSGDAPKETEECQLAGLGREPRVAVYKIPHHGSASSGGEEFLRALSPAVSLLSVGRNNYGHPHASVLETYKKCGLPILRTDREGTFTLTLRKAAAAAP